MKKFLLTLVVIVASMSIFACNSNGINPSDNNGSSGGDLIDIIPLKDRAGDYAGVYGTDSFGDNAQMILRIGEDGTGSIISTDVDKELTPGTLVDGTFGDVNSTETSFTFKFDGEPVGDDSTITFMDNNTVKFVPAGAYFGTEGTEYTLTKQNTELSTRAGIYTEINNNGLVTTVFDDGRIQFLPGSSANEIQFLPDSKAIKFDYKDGNYIIFTSADTLTFYHFSGGKFKLVVENLSVLNK